MGQGGRGGSGPKRWKQERRPAPEMHDPMRKGHCCPTQPTRPKGGRFRGVRAEQPRMPPGLPSGGPANRRPPRLPLGGPGRPPSFHAPWVWAPRCLSANNEIITGPIDERAVPLDPRQEPYSLIGALGPQNVINVTTPNLTQGTGLYLREGSKAFVLTSAHTFFPDVKPGAVQTPANNNQVWFFLNRSITDGELVVRPARYTPVRATAAWVPTDWGTHPKASDANRRFDWALLRLESAPEIADFGSNPWVSTDVAGAPATTGFALPPPVANMEEYKGVHVGSAGYPGRRMQDAPNPGVQVYDAGPLAWIEDVVTFDNQQTGIFRVGVDVGGGQSGSPLYVNVQGAYYVVGVLYGENPMNSPCRYPGAVALTQPVVDTIRNLMQTETTPSGGVPVDYVVLP